MWWRVHLFHLYVRFQTLSHTQSAGQTAKTPATAGTPATPGTPALTGMSSTTTGTLATTRLDYSSSNGSHRGDDSNNKNASPVTIGMSATAGKQQ